jgi:hypothetical protein
VSAPIPLTFTGLQVMNRDGTPELDPAERVNAMFCMGCGRATAVVEEKWVGQQPWREGGQSGKIRWRGVHWWPPVAIAGITDAVPQAIRSCCEEGLRCLGAGTPRGAPPGRCSPDHLDQREIDLLALGRNIRPGLVL